MLLANSLRLSRFSLTHYPSTANQSLCQYAASRLIPHLHIILFECLLSELYFILFITFYLFDDILKFFDRIREKREYQRFQQVLVQDAVSSLA